MNKLALGLALSTGITACVAVPQKPPEKPFELPGYTLSATEAVADVSKFCEENTHATIKGVQAQCGMEVTRIELTDCNDPKSVAHLASTLKKVGERCNPEGTDSGVIIHFGAPHPLTGQ